MATVLVVDDDDSMRNALIHFLQASGFEAVGFASAGDFLLHGRPDSACCLLLDVMMPGPSGLELQNSLIQQPHAIPIIFMTGQATIKSCTEAMKQGAIDFLEKPLDLDKLLGAVRSALQQQDSSRIERAEREKLNLAFESLTARERQIFDMIVAGKLNKQIASDLQLSERTVKAQRAIIMEKLGTDSSAVLGRLAGRRDAVRKAELH
jgi:RNA polymerase sigma factor (sigma-70 family)